MKNTKKIEKPAFIVDATCCVDGADLKEAFILAKVGKVVLTEEEFIYVVERVVEHTLETVNIAEKMFKSFDEVMKCIVKATKKEPWYKRFWNWLTNKK